MRRLTFEELGEAIEAQLQLWPLAKENYTALGRVKRRSVKIGDLDLVLQYNPARAVSTGAAVDAASVAKRPCFLCRSNRPKEQLIADIPSGWDFLVNPYPIFPLHFTIASRLHEPQTAPPAEMVTLAEMCPGMAVFFNGARAGASAPDHLHFQAVSANELPLLRLLEERHPENLDGILTTRELDINLPFGVYSAVIPGGEKGLQILKSILAAQGIDNITGNPDSGLVNTFFWVSRQGGKMRVLVIPRGGHRPEKYGRREDEYLVSPGAVDMAGVLILPREKDFDSLTSDDIIDIYRQTGVSPDKL